MAKTFGILTAASTGFTAVGELSNFSRTSTAEVGYGNDANGEPNADNGGILQPQTISATLEVTGTIPDPKDTIAVAGVTYIITSVGEVWEVGAAYKADIEATIQKT